MKLDPQALIIMAVIGIVAGFLASLLVGGGGGLLRYLILGIVGSFVGGFLLNALNVNLGLGNAMANQVAVSTIGAIVVVILARILA
jgi:uncharacterized membrane protein YeaQ/YmgE (transglycosylase-associated protein family)